MMSRLRLIFACVGFPWLVAASEPSPVTAETRPAAAPATEIAAPPPETTQPATPAASVKAAPMVVPPADTAPATSGLRKPPEPTVEDDIPGLIRQCL